MKIETNMRKTWNTWQIITLFKDPSQRILHNIRYFAKIWDAISLQNYKKVDSLETYPSAGLTQQSMTLQVGWRQGGWHQNLWKVDTRIWHKTHSSTPVLTHVQQTGRSQVQSKLAFATTAILYELWMWVQKPPSRWTRRHTLYTEWTRWTRGHITQQCVV